MQPGVPSNLMLQSAPSYNTIIAFLKPRSAWTAETATASVAISTTQVPERKIELCGQRSIIRDPLLVTVRLAEEPSRFVGRIKNEEVAHMSETSGFPQYAGATSQMRTLAVRITDDLRAQLDVIAQLNDRSVTEEIRLSLEDWIERSKSDPQVLKRAETVRADIEREAQTKRNAIEAIFAKEPAKKATPPSRDAAKDKAPGS